LAVFVAFSFRHGGSKRGRTRTPKLGDRIVNSHPARHAVLDHPHCLPEYLVRINVSFSSISFIFFSSLFFFTTSAGQTKDRDKINKTRTRKE